MCPEEKLYTFIQITHSHSPVETKRMWGSNDWNFTHNVGQFLSTNCQLPNYSEDDSLIKLVPIGDPLPFQQSFLSSAVHSSGPICISLTPLFLNPPNPHSCSIKQAAGNSRKTSQSLRLLSPF